MKLEDVNYFKNKKKSQPKLFNLAKKVFDISQTDSHDKIEFEKKLNALSKAKESSEHLRQASNLVAEIVTFYKLADDGLDPHWVPEGKDPAPDVRYVAADGTQIPVEVKHINTPRDEHEALTKKGTYGGMVDPQYSKGIIQKVQDNMDSAKRKFKQFNKAANGINSGNGTLYLFYSQSIDASLSEILPGHKKMQAVVESIANPIKSAEINLVISDINSYFV